MSGELHDPDCPMTNRDPAAREGCVCDQAMHYADDGSHRTVPEGGLWLDAEDEDLRALHWHVNEGYARLPSNGPYLHKIVMERKLGAPLDAGLEPDHRNRDRLDNRRENLRPATRSQNAANSAKKGTSSVFRGVCWDKARERWTAGIKVDYRRRNLGRFDNEVDAALAHDAAAFTAFGEFAVLNFPEAPR